MHSSALVEHGIAQLPEGDAIDINSRAIDDEWIGLDASDRNEHSAELTFLVEGYIRHEVVNPTHDPMERRTDTDFPTMFISNFLGTAIRLR